MMLGRFSPTAVSFRTFSRSMVRHVPQQAAAFCASTAAQQAESEAAAPAVIKTAPRIKPDVKKIKTFDSKELIASVRGGDMNDIHLMGKVQSVHAKNAEDGNFTVVTLKTVIFSGHSRKAMFQLHTVKVPDRYASSLFEGAQIVLMGHLVSSSRDDDAKVTVRAKQVILVGSQDRDFE